MKQEDKDRISAMVDDILADYHGILEDADFLSEETKAKAVEKLEAIQKYILYPDDWSKYSCKSSREGHIRLDTIYQITDYQFNEIICIEKKMKIFQCNLQLGN